MPTAMSVFRNETLATLRCSYQLCDKKHKYLEAKVALTARVGTPGVCDPGSKPGGPDHLICFMRGSFAGHGRVFWVKFFYLE